MQYLACFLLKTDGSEEGEHGDRIYRVMRNRLNCKLDIIIKIANSSLICCVVWCFI